MDSAASVLRKRRVLAAIMHTVDASGASGGGRARAGAKTCTTSGGSQAPGRPSGPAEPAAKASGGASAIGGAPATCGHGCSCSGLCCVVAARAVAGTVGAAARGAA